MITEMLPITGGLDMPERWRRLRVNYVLMTRRVAAGVDDWMTGDPYQIADWLMLFTPIEEAAWQDIRSSGLPMWPQLPVGRFFLDFGNPVAKVALECDGAAWHDPKKDAERDSWLEEHGWQVFRAPGWRCLRVMDRPGRWDEMDREEREAWIEKARAETLSGILREIRARFGE